MKKEEIIMNQFDGLTAEIYDWECLTPAFLKESLKGDIAEKEMIMAFKSSGTVMLRTIKRQ